MEPRIAEIFSYSECTTNLWYAIKEMYGNQKMLTVCFSSRRISHACTKKVDHLFKIFCLILFLLYMTSTSYCLDLLFLLLFLCLSLINSLNFS